jgi:hypothetical protein
MTILPPPGPDFELELAHICEGAAVLFVDRTPLRPFSENQEAPWYIDHLAWKTKFSSDEATNWLYEIVSVYSAEAAHELRAVSRLLAEGTTTASIDLIVRGVLERAGKVMWLLDPKLHLGTSTRAARAGLEVAISYGHYKETLSYLGLEGEGRATVRANASAHRALLKRWFDIDGPPDNPEDPKSGLTGDAQKWTLDGEPAITYTASAVIAAERAGLTPEGGSGAYGGLSGFSHPSVIFSREVRSIDENGIVEFVVRSDDLEKSVRTAVLSYLNAVDAAVIYYEANVESFRAYTDLLRRRIAEISVIAPSDDRAVSDEASTPPSLET